MKPRLFTSESFIAEFGPRQLFRVPTFLRAILIEQIELGTNENFSLPPNCCKLFFSKVVLDNKRACYQTDIILGIPLIHSKN